MRRGSAIGRLTPDWRLLIPPDRLPLRAGRVHVVRKVDSAGTLDLLNDTWPVGRQWRGQYVRATINTAQQTLPLWHQAGAATSWRLLKTRRFRLQETVQEVLPAFRCNRTRCHEHWPG